MGHAPKMAAFQMVQNFFVRALNKFHHIPESLANVTAPDSLYPVPSSNTSSFGVWDVHAVSIEALSIEFEGGLVACVNVE